MQNAIVIGSGVGGLITAKVLSNHFKEVIVFERNKIEPVPLARKGVPQANHAHVLLSKGANIVDKFFPHTNELMHEQHAYRGDFGEVYWLQHTKWKKHMKAGATTYFASRPVIEWTLQMQLREVPNVKIMDDHKVEDLIYDSTENKVVGVEAMDGNGEKKSFHADFVVDVSGRGSKSYQWFEQNSIGVPPIDRNEVGVFYVTRFYKVPHGYEDLPSIIVSPDIPNDKKYGVLFNVGNTILLTLTGVLDQEVPSDEEGFMEFAKSLEHDVIYRVIQNLEPTSDFYTFSYPWTRWIRYDKMKKFPEGYLVMGDALCSFNPIYGQGMTVVANEANILNEILAKRKGNLKGIHKPFFKKSKPIINLAWGLSSSDMLRYPEAIGKRTFTIKFMNWYMKQVMKASGSAYVNQKFLKVMTFLKSPATLFSPIFIIRMFLARLFNVTYKPEFEPIIERLTRLNNGHIDQVQPEIKEKTM